MTGEKKKTPRWKNMKAEQKLFNELTAEKEQCWERFYNLDYKFFKKPGQRNK